MGFPRSHFGSELLLHTGSETKVAETCVITGSSTVGLELEQYRISFPQESLDFSHRVVHHIFCSGIAAKFVPLGGSLSMVSILNNTYDEKVAPHTTPYSPNVRYF